jgi:hypothetical protein
MRWSGHVGWVGEMRNACKMMFRKPEGKRSYGRTGHMWEDSIRMNLREVGYESVDWIHLTQNRDQWWAVVNIVMNLQVP